MPPSTPVTLEAGKTVTTTDPQIVIAAMDPGMYLFELVVVDDMNLSSTPARWGVTVQPPPPPPPK